VLTLRRVAATGASAAVAVLLATAASPAVAVPTRASAVVPRADVVGGPALANPGIAVHRLAGSTPLPAVAADSWLLADLTTGEVLAAKGAHHRALPASMLKTLTAITLMPQLDRTTEITATDAEVRADGGHVGMVAGATYTLWDLWHGLLLPSANDAAAAIADANGGMAHTVSQMQAMATHLGALDTSVRNDSGLDDLKQLSSAYDMALFARAAMQIPDFQTVTASVSYDFPGRPVAAGAHRATYKIYSQNRLLLHGYPGTIGGKTGFTSLAHRTFWGAASRNGHTLVVTLFQIHDPTEKAARALLDWGFANEAKVAPVGTLVEPGALSPSASSSPAASAPASGGGTTASGSSTATSSGVHVPWKPIALLLAVVSALGALALWWRRRSSGASGQAWQQLPDPSGAVDRPARRSPPDPPTTTTQALRPPTAASAGIGRPSVVVSTPGRVGPVAPGPSPELDAEDSPGVPGVEVTVVDLTDTGPQPPLVAARPEVAAPAPVMTRTVVEPAAAPPRTSPPAAPTSASNVRVSRQPPRPTTRSDSQEPSAVPRPDDVGPPDLGTTPSPEPDPATPDRAGHVRVIRPPSS
jgi:D-alanyl-D-alanine carboxypeptidase (penicillin-binding protein 5/6)